MITDCTESVRKTYTLNGMIAANKEKLKALQERKAGDLSYLIITVN